MYIRRLPDGLVRRFSGGSPRKLSVRSSTKFLSMFQPKQPAPIPLDELSNAHPYEREVKPEDIRIMSDESEPIQDRAQITGRVCSIYFKNHWRRYEVIKVARNYGETQLLCEYADQTRCWVSLLDVGAIRVWPKIPYQHHSGDNVPV